MRLLIGIGLISLFLTSVFAHEQWLISSQSVNDLSQLTPPLMFSQWNFLNASLSLFAFFALLFWIYINHVTYPRLIKRTNLVAIEWSVFSLRLWLGLMLILSSYGLLPKAGIPPLKEPTLFASDLLIGSLPPVWVFLQKLELWMGVFFVIGLFIRLNALFLFFLIVLALYWFGLGMMQYAGFYFGICLFLMINGKEREYIDPKKLDLAPLSLGLLQLLTGLNFIYSAISIKWMQPNIDIFLLRQAHAFTFGLSYPVFTFILLLVEIIMGFLFILGWHLRYISIIFLLLFLLMSINLSENLLAHCFLYGIFSVFIILDGYPLSMLVRKYKKYF